MERILVAAPVHAAKEYCMDDKVKLMASLTWANRSLLLLDTTKTPGFFQRWQQPCRQALIRLMRPEIKSSNTSQQTVADAYNIIRHHAVTEGFHYLAIIEQDNFPPCNFLERLTAYAAAYDAPVIVTPYWSSGKRNKKDKKDDHTLFPRLLALTLVQSGLTDHFDRVMEPGEAFGMMDGTVKPVYGGSFGCCLIRTDVLARVPFSARPDSLAYPDQYFFARCKELGVPVFMDTGIISEHWNEEYLKIKEVVIHWKTRQMG